MDLLRHGSLLMDVLEEHKQLWTSRLQNINEILVPGDQGESVKTWQIFVGVCNDGIFDRETLSATEMFQFRCGLGPVGLVDEVTLACAQIWCMNHGILSLQPDRPRPPAPTPTYW